MGLSRFCMQLDYKIVQGACIFNVTAHCEAFSPFTFSDFHAITEPCLPQRHCAGQARVVNPDSKGFQYLGNHIEEVLHFVCYVSYTFVCCLQGSFLAISIYLWFRASLVTSIRMVTKQKQ